MVTGGCILAVTVSPVFFVTIPICLFSFVYFGVMRYDDDGNPTGDSN